MENIHYQINEDKVLFSELDEEGVLFDIEKNQYLSINETFTTIFICLQKGMSAHEILVKLLNDYEIDQAACQNELNKAINQLITLNFIKIK